MNSDDNIDRRRIVGAICCVYYTYYATSIMIVEYCHQLIHFWYAPETIFYADKFAITTQIVFCRSSFHIKHNRKWLSRVLWLRFKSTYRFCVYYHVRVYAQQIKVNLQ